jgi:restriction endonuclease S subunit
MWKTVKLGEIANWIRGLTYSKKDEVESAGIAVLRATNINLATHKIVLDEVRLVSDSVKVKEEKYAQVGDLLVCTASGSKSHVGKVAIVEEDLRMAFGGFMAALRCREDCYPRFLYYVLTSQKFKWHLNNLGDGANINNLKFSQIEGFEFSLPPLAEQQRIVAKLDAAFAEIDKAIEVANAKETEVQKFKDSLLSSSLGGNAVMWKTVKLGEIANWIRGLTYSKKDEVESAGIAVLRATNINLATHKIVLDEVRLVSDSVKVKEEKYAQVGDLLVCTASGSKSHVGKVAIVEEDLRMAFGGFMAALRCREDCYPRFLYYVLTSQKFKWHLNNLGDGANINNLKFSQIEGFEFSLPPLAEQQRIVA